MHLYVKFLKLVSLFPVNQLLSTAGFSLIYFFIVGCINRSIIKRNQAFAMGGFN